MALASKDDKTLRRYLLGVMSHDEQQAFERWLMTDEDAYDLLNAAEDDLIDASLAGKLDRHELEQFNSHFLVAPERKRKLWFGRAFRKFVNEANASADVQKPAVSFWNLFRLQPALGYATAALFVLIGVGGLWGVLTVQDLRHQLQSATAELTTERETFQRQLDESQARLQANFQALEQAVANLKPSSVPDTRLALNLTPGLSRSSSEVPQIALTPKTKLVELRMLLLDDNYDSYQATLVDDSGKELWPRDRLDATAAEGGKAVVLIVPTELFSTGQYSVRLSGRSGTNPPESIGAYHFNATR